MAKIELKGLNEYTKALSRLSAQYKKEVIGEAIYGAAGIVADEIAQSTLPKDPERLRHRRLPAAWALLLCRRIGVGILM